MPQTITPEVRAAICAHMTKASELFMRDLVKGFFEEPKTSMAKQVTLEAVSKALVRTLGPEVMQTFVYELQDQLQGHLK